MGIDQHQHDYESQIARLKSPELRTASVSQDEKTAKNSGVLALQKDNGRAGGNPLKQVQE
jgi:hypothetical protein